MPATTKTVFNYSGCRQLAMMFLTFVMNTISFVGITGTILESSPHGNYLVVELSKRITICGTYSNQFDWEISSEEESGFESFITYIGLQSSNEVEKIKTWLINHGGYFKGNEDIPRPSKRVRHFPLEIKVRGLPAESVAKLAKAKKV